jgi:hypothetical protein
MIAAQVQGGTDAAVGPAAVLNGNAPESPNLQFVPLIPRLYVQQRIATGQPLKLYGKATHPIVAYLQSSATSNQPSNAGLKQTIACDSWNAVAAQNG